MAKLQINLIYSERLVRNQEHRKLNANNSQTKSVKVLTIIIFSYGYTRLYFKTH